MLTAQNRCVFGLAEPRTMSNRQGVEGQQQIIQQPIVSSEVRWPLGLWRLCKMCVCSNERDEISTLPTAVNNVQLHNKVFAWKLNFLWPKEVYSKCDPSEIMSLGVLNYPILDKLTGVKIRRLKSGGENPRWLSDKTSMFISSCLWRKVCGLALQLEKNDGMSL